MIYELQWPTSACSSISLLQESESAGAKLPFVGHMQSLLEVKLWLISEMTTQLSYFPNWKKRDDKIKREK